MHPQELELWQELKDALAAPQSADLKRLFQLFDRAIAQLPEHQRLRVAGAAIEQIAAVYTLKADWLITKWEETCEAAALSLPVLTAETLDAWIRQSMSIDLEEMVEESASKRAQRAPKPQSTDSIAAIVDQASLLKMLDQMESERDPEQMVRQLAGEEEPVKWATSIAQWLQKYASNQPVSIRELQFGLKMPWVEIWIGLLLGTGFSLKKTGAFYSNEVWVRYIFLEKTP